MFTKVSLLVSLNIKYFLTQYFYPLPNTFCQLFLLHLFLFLKIYIFNLSDKFSSFVVTKPRDKLLRARQVTVLVVTALVVRPAITYGLKTVTFQEGHCLSQDYLWVRIDNEKKWRQIQGHKSKLVLSRP